MNEIVAAVLVQSTIKEFHESIKEFNAQSAKQNARMLQLTLGIAALTLVMTIAVGVQIYLAVKPTPQSPLVPSTSQALQGNLPEGQY